MEVRPPTKPNVTTSIRGDIAEVWRGDTKLGLLYQWTIHGTNGEWTGDALKYRLQSAGGGEVELRLFLTAPGGAALTILAHGHLVGDQAADGELHREAVSLRGTRLEVA